MSEEKVRLQTGRFGELELDRASFINLPGGLIGFPDVATFVLLDYTPPFSFLQAVDNPDLAFVVVNSAEFGEEYQFELPYQDRAMDLGKEDEVAIFNLVTIRPDPTLSTVNLKAPVVVNLRNRVGKQVILDDPRFPTRLPLYAQKQEGHSSSPEAEGK